MHRCKGPMRVLRLVLWLLLATLLMPGFGAAAAPRPSIVTSFFPLYCWAVNVAGTNAVVENLLPPRAEPHDYAFTIGDARKLTAADLIVVNGLGLEGWLPKFLKSSPDSRTRVVKISDGLKVQLIAGEHQHGHDHADHDESDHANPHLWLDPQLAAHGVSNILVALQRVDPAHAAVYARNAQAYLATLQKLDADIRQSLAGATNRALVTYHDAFPYFARRYGLEIAGLVELIPEVNPTAKHLARLDRTLRERGLKIIYVPTAGATPVARRIARDLRVTLAELDTLESGPLIPSAYEERMRANAAVLQKNLK